MIRLFAATLTSLATGWHDSGWLPLCPLCWCGIAAGGSRPASGWRYSTVFGVRSLTACFFHFASSGSLTSLSSLTFLTPVFALLFGNLFLCEFLSPLQWVGLPDLSSIYLINQRETLAKAGERIFPKEASTQSLLESSAAGLTPELPVTESESEILP